MKVIKGDLLNMADQGHFDVIVQGCNCFNAMGSGIAWQIAQRYPAARNADNLTVRGAKDKLGMFTSAVVPTKTTPEKTFTIVNAYTQYGTNSGPNHEDLFEYAAFAQCLTRMVKTFGNVRYGFPLIGCGLAGGDRSKILKIIEDNVQDSTIVEWAMIND